MASTTTQTQIVNRALQLLGSQSISIISENSRGARAMNRAYQPVLLKTLRENLWSFAMKRVVLAASTTLPVFGKAQYFPLPADFVRLGPPDNFGQDSTIGSIPPNLTPNYNSTDWQIENMGGSLAIASNDSGPLYLRYVSSDITEAMFDVIFAEAFACLLAVETCEEITQSGPKLQVLAEMYKDTIRQARKINAFEMQPMRSPVDSWVTKRL